MNEGKRCGHCGGKRCCKQCYARMSDEELVTMCDNIRNPDLLRSKIAHFKSKKEEIQRMEAGIEEVHKKLAGLYSMSGTRNKRIKAITPKEQ